MAIRFQGVKTKTREPYYSLRSQPVGVGFGLVWFGLDIFDNSAPSQGFQLCL